MPCTRHRVFLATLIVACKYLNDSAPKNKHWAEYAGGMFDPAEINLMEKQLLFLLDYDLRFDENEAIRYFSPFMPRLSSSVKETRAAAVNCAKARVQAHISMPPTPPHEDEQPRTSNQTLSGVQSLVKRLSSTYLSVSLNHSSPSRARPISRASSSSTADSESTSSSGDSEMGWTTSSGGSPASTEASSVAESEDESSKVGTAGSDALAHDVPSTLLVKEGRKVSASSVGTVKMDAIGSSATSFLRVLASSSSVAISTQANTEHTGQRSSLTHSATANGFLSRMWGAATKTQDRSDPANAFRRRLTHSKSAFFRSHQSHAVDA